MCVTIIAFSHVHVLPVAHWMQPRGAHKGEIIDPYVKLSVHGAAGDTLKTPITTRTIEDNGFNGERCCCCLRAHTHTRCKWLARQA
jgi:hypothetical protein